MVLGVLLIESLGPVLWDFNLQTLAFIHNGRHVLLLAMPSLASIPTVTMTAPDMLDDLLL
jgi:hypothetical protein